MRNHRKILMIDGQIAFTGGLNIGDEYLGKNPRYGFWRDTHLRLQGPAVADLQSVFVEDWDFAAHENLQDAAYFPAPSEGGPHPVQIIQSGPDREQKGIREMYFAAILRAQHRAVGGRVELRERGRAHQRGEHFYVKRKVQKRHDREHQQGDNKR